MARTEGSIATQTIGFVVGSSRTRCLYASLIAIAQLLYVWFGAFRVGWALDECRFLVATDGRVSPRRPAAHVFNTVIHAMTETDRFGQRPVRQCSALEWLKVGHCGRSRARICTVMNVGARRNSKESCRPKTVSNSLNGCIRGRRFQKKSVLKQVTTTIFCSMSLPFLVLVDIGKAVGWKSIVQAGLIMAFGLCLFQVGVRFVHLTLALGNFL
jgi:hypothetical protein